MSEDKTFTIYTISKKEDLDKLISILNKKHFETRKCVICKTKIYNYNSERVPKNIIEKFLYFFGKRFLKWTTNFGSVSYNPKGFVCDDLKCFMELNMNYTAT